MKKILIVLFLLVIPSIVIAAPATMYVTVAGAGAKNGASWATAMGYAEWETDLEGASEAGDIYYVAEGTYTLTSDLAWSARDGTGALPISIIGVKSGTSAEPPTVSDWADGATRPLVATGASYNVLSSDYNVIRNLNFTIANSWGIQTGSRTIVINCKSYQSSGSADYRAFRNVEGYGQFIDCEAISTNGIGIEFTTYGGIVRNCYIHDTKNGIVPLQASTYDYSFNIFDTISGAGISLTTTPLTQATFNNNVFYGCVIGISGGTSSSITAYNNIFHVAASQTGVSWTSSVKHNVFDYNNFYNAGGTLRTNVDAGVHDTSVDPEFTDAPNGNFSLAGTSDCIGAAFSIRLGVGL